MIKYITGFVIVVATASILAIIYFYKSINYDLDKLIEYSPATTTQVYDSKGRLIANVFSGENRLYAPYSEFPSILVETIVATEDTGFFEHKGISFEAILRALVKDIIAGKAVEGASTLTQQLVKTTILTSEKTLTRKIKEAFISFKLEEKLSKQEILERYLNHIYFGHGYYGVKTAALGYFHKNLSQLTLKEVAILCGLPKAPSFFDPIKNMDGANQRANTIINRMHYLGWIDNTTHANAVAELPKVYNDAILLNRAPYAVDTAVRMLQSTYPDIKNGGYRIDLTIDIDLQEAADVALKRQYESIVKENSSNKNIASFNGAIISMSQESGDVLALSGGVNFAKSPFNRITQAKRQAGSSFKPFIYLVAMENGFTPDSTVMDAPKSYSFTTPGGVKKEWSPQNYDMKFEGAITLREALTHSKNLATISLVEQLGLPKVRSELARYGFKGLQDDLSIALGSYTLSPLELAELFTIITNQGTKVTPRLVKSIQNKSGQITVFEAKKESIAEASSAFSVVEMLKEVVRRGTGTKAAVAGIETAGKTGTTNDYRDAWFCGFTPATQTIVWFGNDNNQPLPGKMTGGVVAAPVFAEYTTALLKFYPDTQRGFVQPQATLPAETTTEENSTQP